MRGARRSEDNCVETGKAEIFGGVEGFGVGAVNRAAEVLVDGSDVAGDGTVVGAGAAGIELGLVAVDGIDLFLPEGGDVEAEGGGEVDAEVGAEVVDDAFAVVGFAGDGGFGELGVEAGVFADAGDGDVVGVGVVGVGKEKDVGAELAVQGGDAVAGFEGVGDFAVFEAGGDAGDAEDFAAAAASLARVSSEPKGVGSPVVMSTSVTAWPAAARRAMVPPMASSWSSGCGPRMVMFILVASKVGNAFSIGRFFTLGERSGRSSAAEARGLFRINQNVRMKRSPGLPPRSYSRLSLWSKRVRRNRRSGGDVGADGGGGPTEEEAVVDPGPGGTDEAELEVGDFVFVGAEAKVGEVGVGGEERWVLCGVGSSAGFAV